MKRILALALVALLPVYAASAIISRVYTLDTQTARTTSSTGSSQQLWQGVKACAGRLSVKNNSGTNPTFDAKIQYSFDQTNWFDELSFLQVTTTGGVTVYKVVHIDTTVTRQYPFVRSVVTLGGTSPSYDYTVNFDCE